jgi:hypothetical protein
MKTTKEKRENTPQALEGGEGEAPGALTLPLFVQ